jgi:hypothetical protein
MVFTLTITSFIYRLLPALADKTLSSVDRAALLSDAYALAKAGTGYYYI